MIRNLIFDVGNVLFEYRWIEALEDTGLSRQEAFETGTAMLQDDLWVRHDAATISTEDMISEFGKRYPKIAKNIEEFVLHGERMHIPRPEVWDKVHRLKLAGYRIYLLSNYSEYLFKMHTDGAPFMDDLDGRLVSYEVHQVKPNADIYETLLERYDLKPEECIFFDDRKENIDTAESLGIKSVTVESREHINSVLNDILNGTFV